MFEECKTLQELNMRRIQLSQEEDLVTVNNEYNKRRTEILSARVSYTKVTPVFVSVKAPVKYSRIPIAGRSNELNTIKLTPEGFLY